MTAQPRVPDDPRDLDDDRWRLYEEWSRSGRLRHAPDAPRSEHHPSRWREGLPWFGRHGTRTLPITFMAAGVAAMLAVLLLPLWGRSDRPPDTAPLAITGSPPGTVGGLLPSATVSINGSPRALRDLRPAALLVIPPVCTDCSGMAQSVAQAASAARVRTLVAGDPAATSAVSAAAQAATATPVELPPNVVADLGATPPFVVVVGRDGVITGICPASDTETIAAAARDAVEEQR